MDRIPELPRELGVRGVRALIYHEDGKEGDRLAGAVPPAVPERMLDVG